MVFYTAGIRGWNYDETEIYDGLEMISRQVIRLSGVIQNIRDFTRAGAE